MKLDARLKKLQDKAGIIQGLWAVFTMKDYADPSEKAAVKKRLLEEYLSKGNAQPVGCLYWNEIVGADISGNKDEFLYTSPTNPLEDMLNRIDEQSRDPLEELA